MTEVHWLDVLPDGRVVRHGPRADNSAVFADEGLPPNFNPDLLQTAHATSLRWSAAEVLGPLLSCQLFLRLFPRVRMVRETGECSDVVARFYAELSARINTLWLEQLPPPQFTVASTCRLRLRYVEGTPINLTSVFGAANLSVFYGDIVAINLRARLRELDLEACDVLQTLICDADCVRVYACNRLRSAVVHGRPSSVTIQFCPYLAELEFPAGFRPNGRLLLRSVPALRRVDPGTSPLARLRVPGATRIPPTVHLRYRQHRGNRRCIADHAAGGVDNAAIDRVFAAMDAIRVGLPTMLVLVVLGRRRRGAPRLPPELWWLIFDDYFRNPLFE
jgi:hypothetical protein